LPDHPVWRSRSAQRSLNVRVARPTAAVAHAVVERRSARPSCDQAETTPGHASSTPKERSCDKGRLAALLRLATAGQVTLRTAPYLLAVGDAIADLEQTRVRGRAILTP
jgi:hypothetical protein